MSSGRRASVPDEDDDVAARVTSLLKIGAPLAVVLLAIGLGVVRGTSTAILVLAAGALAAVIALFWQSVRTLVGETPLSGADAFAIAAPRAEEEKKRAVLRALKDLEFEKSVGKISPADYDELVLAYRAEARSLLQQLDHGAKPRRDRVLTLVDERLRRAGLSGGLDEAREREVASPGQPAQPDASEAPTAPTPLEGPATTESDDEASEAAGERAARGSKPGDDHEPDLEASIERATCASCSASNEVDAAFCKKCGAKMATPEVDADAR